MKTFRADLHIHSVLSPCGDLEMSPGNIVEEASRKGIDIIGITDHNTTRHAALVTRLAEKKGIFVLTGAEINTKEEVHSLVFFENSETLSLLQEYIDENLPDILNLPEVFGHQVEVDEHENIIYEEKRLLASAIRKSITELEKFVHLNKGIFIPSHIDRFKNSIYSQLGLLPENLNADALEVSRATTIDKFSQLHPEIRKYSLTRSSDAHQPCDIGKATTTFLIEKADFNEIRMALAGTGGRGIITS
jgi:PHP family Zn ribbon phosphoesterase